MSATMLHRLRMAVKTDILNLRTTATARWLLIGSTLMTIVSPIANLAVIDTAELADDASIEVAMHASTVATLIFATLVGIISATSDFRFGRIDQMLLSEPSRPIIAASKAVVGALTGLVYGIVGAIVAVAVVFTYYTVQDVPLDLASSIIVYSVLGVIAGAALFAMVGVGIGIAVPNQPAAIGGTLAFFMVVEPTLLIGVPAIGKWLPLASGLSLTSSPDPNLLPQLAGGVVLCAWAALSTSLANRRLQGADI